MGFLDKAYNFTMGSLNTASALLPSSPLPITGRIQAGATGMQQLGEAFGCKPVRDLGQTATDTFHEGKRIYEQGQQVCAAFNQSPFASQPQAA